MDTKLIKALRKLPTDHQTKLYHKIKILSNSSSAQFLTPDETEPIKTLLQSGKLGFLDRHRVLIWAKELIGIGRVYETSLQSLRNICRREQI